MDLCLGCKACKSECPSSVDMAQIKSEYLVHYYKENGLPLFNRMMGWLPTLNRTLYGIPGMAGLANWGLKSPLAKPLLNSMGIHPDRHLPAYAKETFEQWFAKRSLRQAQGTEDSPKGTPSAELVEADAPNGTVILFHDTWTNYNEPAIGEAMIQVLEAAGYAVQLATGRQCCGRPLITGGQADKAKPWIDHNVALLAPYAQQGLPIVGAEPSCILTLRDEYLNLASDPAQAEQVAQQVFTFEEFVVSEQEAGRLANVWPSQSGKALLHGHCHQKALVGNEASVAALSAAGYEVEVINSGCCGMAGDFGYTKEHYEVSRTIGEERLMPAVRAADESTTVVASGTSCRHQIEDFADRRPVHLAEALAAALG